MKPYRWKLPDGELLEVPVTTLPILRVPIHLSYVLYLSTFSPWLARTYFAGALRLCRATGVEPSILLHPLDFLSGSDVPTLRFFPAMGLDIARKLERTEYCLTQLQALFEVRSMGEHVRAASDRAGLQLREAKFSG